jgi:YbgC/YbaW family acyl-CoA thioester hydrolase
MRSFDRDELLSAPPRFEHPVRVRFQDVDAAGIVFYPRILEYFHDAYVAWLASLGVDLARVLAERSWAAPIRQVEAEFLRPVTFGDLVGVAVVALAAEGGDLAVGFRVHQDGKAVAVGRSVHSFLDRATWKRLPAIPDAIAAAAV